MKMNNVKSTVIVAVLIAAAFVCVLHIYAPQVKAAPSITVLSLNGRWLSNILVHEYDILCEIKNVGDTPAANITVTVSFYNASDTFITSKRYDLSSYGPSISIMPEDHALVLHHGSKLSFLGAGPNEAQGGQKVDHCTATISYHEAAALSPMLQVTVTNVSVISNGMSVRGTIKNVGGSTADVVYVYVTGYDSNGVALGSGLAFLYNLPLDPSQTSNFEVVCTGAIYDAAKVASYVVTAQSFAGDAVTGTAQYTDVSEVTGVVPEFPSVICMLLLMMAVSAVVVLQKKRQF